MLLTGRHAAPRVRPALLLPAVLLLSSAVATTGLAVLPAAADAPTGGSAAAQVAPPAAPAAAAEDELLSAWRSGTQDEQASRERSTTAAWQRAARAVERRRTAALRASRARRPAPAPEAAPPPTPPPPAVVRPGVGPLTSRFGPRWGRMHAGIDLAAGTGAPVSAVADGLVLTAGSEGGYGNVVRVQHGHGTVSLYAHLSQVLVSAGQTVPAGALLGREGSSGHSTGPHLHFEVRIGDAPVDPQEWLRARGLSL